MIFAASNIGLPAHDHEGFLGELAACGVRGLEVAPSRVWRDTSGIANADVAAYRRAVEGAGLEVIGLHSLFFDRPDLGLFRAADRRRESLEFLVHLSGICRDLGGRTLIWGGGRRRGSVSKAEAFDEAVNFVGDLCTRIDSHGTSLCFEPLGPADSDFINSVQDVLAIVEAVGHRRFAIQLDAKALYENGEDDAKAFSAVSGRLVHFHANQPGLLSLDEGPVNHSSLGACLRRIGYNGFVSIEQRLTDEADPMKAMRRSVSVLKSCYT